MKYINNLLILTIFSFILFSCKRDNDDNAELPQTDDVVMLKIDNQNWKGKAKFSSGVDITAYTDAFGSEANPEFTLHIDELLIKEGQKVGIMGKNAVTYISHKYNNKTYISYNGPAIEIGKIMINKTGDRLIGSFETKVYIGSSEKEITNGYFNVKAK